MLLNRSSKGCQGFSLVELLVGVAILAILAALFLVGTQKAVEMGNQAACLANMHQYGNGVLLAIADHHGSIDADLDENGLPILNAFVSPYLSGELICPDWRKRYPGQLPYGGGTYAINRNLWTYFRKVETCPIPHNRVVLASETYSGDYFCFALHLDLAMWGTYNGTPQTIAQYADQMRPSVYHGSSLHRGLNMFMLDGSAALVVPVDGGWNQFSATYGEKGNQGYYYDDYQFRYRDW